MRDSRTHIIIKYLFVWTYTVVHCAQRYTSLSYIIQDGYYIYFVQIQPDRGGPMRIVFINGIINFFSTTYLFLANF